MPSNTHQLLQGEFLKPDQSLTSLNGLYTFVYQTDGNLVLYRNADRRPLWHSKTHGKPGRECIMQSDGNLVIYGHDSKAIWHTNTHRNPGSRLEVQDDGNVVIYNVNGGAIWATGSVQVNVPTGPRAQGDDMQPGEVLNPNHSLTSRNGLYTFVYQTDGNLVLYRNADGRPLWASRTDRRPGNVCIMQSDGNLVIYGLDGVIWHTNTHRNPGSRFVVQDDGNVVIYNANGGPTWQTFTAPPAIRDFTPTSGQSGNPIIIRGSNFVANNYLSLVESVHFGNASAKYTVDTGEKITAFVPDNAKSGPISVVSLVGTGVSRNSFTVRTATSIKKSADIWVDESWIDPSPFMTVNAPFTIFFRFRNIGETATGEYTIRLILNNNEKSVDVKATSCEPGAFDTVWWKFPNGLRAGVHDISAHFDIENKVKEENKINNVGRNQVTVRE